MTKLVIIIPAYNEEETIGSVIDRIPLKIPGISDVKVLVIDDGSTDKTPDIVKERGIEILSFPRNLGLGVTFRKGIEKALDKKADIIVNIDGDGQFDPLDIPKIVTPILEGKAEFVTASRFVSRDPRLEMSRIKLIGNKLMSFIISKIVGHKFYDVSCGFRAYSRDAALWLNLFGRFTYTQESFIDLAYKGIPILEVPILVKGEREHGKSKVASNLFKYGYNTIKIIILAFRDYKPLKLMSIISNFFFFIGFAAGGFFMVHYINTGSFRPNTWAGFVSGASFATALSLMFVGIFLESIGRMRMNQERLLYYSRKRFYSLEDESINKESTNQE